MDAHALTVKTGRDGPACALVLSGDLGLLETGGFPEQAAPAVDDRAAWLGSGPAGVLVLGCAAVRVRRIAMRSALGGCPVIVCPLNSTARRIIELLGLDRANLPERSLGDGLRDGPRDNRTGPQELISVELGALILAGTESCP